MLPADIDTAPALAELTFDDRRSGLSRRAFLQGALAAGTIGAALPSWAVEAFGATPLAPTDGILVVVMMGGGNDGLNMVVPHQEGAYHDRRGRLAIADPLTLPGTSLGLHPALTGVAQRFAAGEVAIVEGVGYPNPDLSHFTSMAHWMSGWFGRATTSGWAGRYLDGAGTNLLRGVAIGSGVPLHMSGQSFQSVSLPVGSPPPGVSSQDWEARLFASMEQTAGTSTGRGALADAVARTCTDMMLMARDVAPAYVPEPPGGELVGDMTLAAQLINADVGARVISVGFGDFDTHANQAYTHNRQMQTLDAALSAFWATLSTTFSQRVCVMTFSEFGRRVAVNGSNGTDHGTAAPMLVMGPRVRGGVHGASPSLTSLDRSGNLVATSDFRQVYAELIDVWLAGSSSAVLGANFEPHGLLAGAPSEAAPPSAPPPAPAPPPSSPPPAPGAFVDVDPNAFYGGPVAWLAAEGITTGVGGSDRFEPSSPVTRAEMVTFLWRFAGEPAATGPVPFADVQSKAFYTTAVTWAARERITTGVSGSDRFDPGGLVTRGEMATFMWRYAGQPRPSRRSGMVDVDRRAFYATPVDFLAEHRITTGVGGSDRFEPGAPVSRGQMATFLWRFDRAGFRAR